MKETKGVVAYLLVAFGVTFAVFFTLRGFGLFPMSDQNLFQLLVFWALLFVPALAAIIARRAEGAGVGEGPKVWPLPWGKALRIAVVVFAIFAVQSVIIGVASLADFQPTMPTLTKAVLPIAERILTVLSRILPVDPTVPPEVVVIIPVLGYTFAAVVSLALGMTVSAIVALGSEYGWRGYLQPRLDQLGELRGTIAVGLLWAVWWMPFLYFGFHDHDRSNIEAFAQFAPRLVIILVLLGSVSASIYRRTGHAGLCAVFLGCVYSQLDGLWFHLLQHPVYPWAGRFGMIAAALWLVAALLPGLFVGKPKAETGEEKT